MAYHLGMIVSLINGDYYIDEYGNVFLGKSWAGRGDFDDVVSGVIKGLVNKYGYILFEDVSRIVSVIGRNVIVINKKTGSCTTVFVLK